MKNRYEKFVLEAEKGITFEVSNGTKGELIIRALNIATDNVCSANYANPPILKRYKHIYGEWNNGFVVERVSDGSQFVWIPVGSLDSNGTLNGVTFNEKFGRRNYLDDEFSDGDLYESKQEQNQCLERVIRGGYYFDSGYSGPVAYRQYEFSTCEPGATGFRAALCIK